MSYTFFAPTIELKIEWVKLLSATIADWKVKVYEFQSHVAAVSKLTDNSVTQKGELSPPSADNYLGALSDEENVFSDEDDDFEDDETPSTRTKPTEAQKLQEIGLETPRNDDILRRKDSFKLIAEVNNIKTQLLKEKVFSLSPPKEKQNSYFEIRKRSKIMALPAKVTKLHLAASILAKEGYKSGYMDKLGGVVY